MQTGPNFSGNIWGNFKLDLVLQRGDYECFWLMNVIFLWLPEKSDFGQKPTFSWE